ncbi:GIY-YIG nuclease family protein [Anabaena sp. FACHB-1237]|uniref:GIY-YIG nuclease family protein n=1 Tax=Anabaena sp. FACHB-1237 TaxID=2692769 RepID=UPI00168147A8|nr:GIY-YIG nuclease family protein [Anabaena sp. FACHB-1237]MBD2137585.1 GIY-YIG nuclease family protein [Anabaena sp. FACHB-1237]
MTTITTNPPTLASLEYFPYIDSSGNLLRELEKKIGVYAIFNQDKHLEFIGYSRDVYLSLKQHLVRLPEKCYWLKFVVIERPNRSILEDITKMWIEENGTIPQGNAQDKEKWHDPINVTLLMTETERNNYEIAIDDLAKSKVLKNVARRVEEEICQVLKARGVHTEIKFNPKLKDLGLLDLK